MPDAQANDQKDNPKLAMKKAFVIMPFAPEFSSIYEQFIKPTLEDAGYEVTRADDILSEQSILRGVIKGLVTADLVVADLTDSNANVYYELGIAHGHHKPVIMLTQDISALPFDLRAYRVIPYSTHFAEIDETRAALKKIAVEAFSGNMSFGSPVTDFASVASNSAKKPLEVSVDATAPMGSLDHLVSLEDGFKGMTEMMLGVASDTETLHPKMENFNKNLQTIAKSGAPDVARRAQRVMMIFSRELDSYAGEISSRNTAYAEALAAAAQSLEAVVRDALIATQEPKVRQEREELIRSLENMEKNAGEAKRTFQETIETLSRLPNLERMFTRARDNTVKQLTRLVDNIDQTIAMARRVRSR